LDVVQHICLGPKGKFVNLKSSITNTGLDLTSFSILFIGIFGNEMAWGYEKAAPIVKNSSDIIFQLFGFFDDNYY
jgi:hypothetical protein